MKILKYIFHKLLGAVEFLAYILGIFLEIVVLFLICSAIFWLIINIIQHLKTTS